MIPSGGLALILTVCLKIYLTESYCIISPGNSKLVNQSYRVVVVLNCSLHGEGFDGEGFDTVHWTMNGQPVAEGQITTDPLRKKKWSAVFLTNVTTDKDLSEFKCVMSSGEEYTSSCYASPGKPKLRSLERVKIANSGVSPMIGHCRADGWPTPHASWWRNGLQIFDGDLHSSYVVSNPTDNESVLKIIDIEGYHHGMYTCRAENMFGTAEEAVNIIVKRFRMIKWRPELGSPVVALEGNNSTLECVCEKDECREETARAYWKFKDHEVSQSDRIKLSKVVSIDSVKITMTILNVSRIDEGEYFCGIKTSKGFGEEKGNLFVLTKVSERFPRVRVTSKEVNTNLYSTVRLTCEARYPSVLEKPVTYWFSNDTLINAKTVQHYHHNVYKPRERPNSTTILPFDLQITNVSSKDFGWYSCAVEFTVGEAKVHLSQDLKLAKKRDIVEDEKPIGTGSQDNPLVAISSITAGGIIMGFVIAFVAYRLCRNKRNTEEPFFETPVDGHQFTYDVFVTFSSQDLNWVKKELIPLVEKHELNYCIHDRDFEIGKPVVDNMAQSVYTSRKVLAVMSHNYMSSKFCRGELEMALYRSTEMGDSSVIVMRIDGVDRSKLPKALRNRTFLDYHDFTERKNWEERLIKHLKPPPIEKCTEKHSEKSYTLLQNTEV